MKFAFLIVATLFATLATAELRWDDLLAAERRLALRKTRKLGDFKSNDGFQEEILSAHNVYRSIERIPSLYWSSNLAEKAQQWADNLAFRNAYEHRCSDVGENLWIGTNGEYSYTDMVVSWGSERRYFRGGIYPDVSTTGDSEDVSDFTQIIWRTTTYVGCGGAAGSDDQYRLVCRYDPPGNVHGEAIYLTPTQAH